MMRCLKHHLFYCTKTDKHKIYKLILYPINNNFIRLIYLKSFNWNVSIKRSNSSHCRAWTVQLIHVAACLSNANNELRWLSALVPIAFFDWFHEFFAHKCLFFMELMGSLIAMLSAKPRANFFGHFIIKKQY